MNSRDTFRRLPTGNLFLAVLLLALNPAVGRAGECDKVPSPAAWIFCDDFEDGTALVREGRYFEYVDDDGEFIPVAGAGLNGSVGMRAIWQTGEVGAGNFKLGFGRNPSSYMDQGIRPEEDFREIYYRMYVRMEPGWQGNPFKLSRATVIAASDWSQAMIAHVWEGGGDVLGVDPVRCVGAGDQVVCIGYNDFSNMSWLGFQGGTTPVFHPDESGRWLCVEAHVRLNDPGASNGVQEFWIDGQLEARRDGLDFVHGYTDYAINAVFFENWWNGGAIRDQERYFDNIVVSTQPIGCEALGSVFDDDFESGTTSAWSASVP
ncbi:MAG: hypothetical protein MPN21_27505 [Thermoanaerobaculia bacterium]|nr:hypothetical protein [Thermoanaerobaculia bacterium]